MEFVRCVICDHDNTVVLFESKQTYAPGPVVKCRECGLIYVNPREFEEQWIDSPEIWKRYIKEVNYKKKNFCDRLKRIEKQKRKGRLLEIGCHIGIFLHEAGRSGWECYGVEPALASVQYAKEVYNLDVFHGFLSEVQYPENFFDVIVMLGVIEHMPSPLQDLKEIERILKPNGLLTIETPNIDNLGYKILKSKWRHFNPSHYYFFSPTTIAHLLDKAGFRIVQTESVAKIVSIEHFLVLIGAHYSRNLALRVYKMARYLGIHKIPLMGILKIPLKITLGDLMLVFANEIDKCTL